MNVLQNFAPSVWCNYKGHDGTLSYILNSKKPTYLFIADYSFMWWEPKPRAAYGFLICQINEDEQQFFPLFIDSAWQDELDRLVNNL